LAQRLLAGTFREGDHSVIDANEEGVLSFTHQTETPETPDLREIVAA